MDHGKKINRRGHRGSQRGVIFLCVPLRSLRFFESPHKIIKILEFLAKKTRKYLVRY